MCAKRNWWNAWLDNLTASNDSRWHNIGGPLFILAQCWRGYLIIITITITISTNVQVLQRTGYSLIQDWCTLPRAHTYMFQYRTHTILIIPHAHIHNIIIITMFHMCSYVNIEETHMQYNYTINVTVHSHTCTHTHVHTPMCTHHTHTYTHTHTHTHTQTHKHIQDTWGTSLAARLMGYTHTSMQELWLYWMDTPRACNCACMCIEHRVVSH